MSTPAGDVDEYLAAVPEAARATLAKLRATIKSVVPDAVEVISYQVPTFKYRGRMLVGYAAFKNHCSLFVMGTAAMDAHREDIRGYETAKATVRFPIGAPLPEALITKLVRARIAENEAAARARAARSGRKGATPKPG